jgi:ribonuclease P protein component
MNRRYRLTNSTDIKRVRREGKSYAHPFAVLITKPNRLASSRFGVMAGRNVGGAIVRNRAKRRIRAVLAPLIALVNPGWDVMFIARRSIVDADWHDLQHAIQKLLRRSELIE